MQEYFLNLQPLLLQRQSINPNVPKCYDLEHECPQATIPKASAILLLLILVQNAKMQELFFSNQRRLFLNPDESTFENARGWLLLHPSSPLLNFLNQRIFQTADESIRLSLQNQLGSILHNGS